MSVKYNYGENELKLFEYFGWDREVVQSYPRTIVVRAVALEVFWKGLSGKQVEALRRYTRAHENMVIQTEDDWNDIAKVEE